MMNIIITILLLLFLLLLSLLSLWLHAPRVLARAPDQGHTGLGSYDTAWFLRLVSLEVRRAEAAALIEL